MNLNRRLSELWRPVWNAGMQNEGIEKKRRNRVEQKVENYRIWKHRNKNFGVFGSQENKNVTCAQETKLSWLKAWENIVGIFPLCFLGCFFSYVLWSKVSLSFEKECNIPLFQTPSGGNFPMEFNPLFFLWKSSIPNKPVEQFWTHAYSDSPYIRTTHARHF